MRDTQVLGWVAAFLVGLYLLRPAGAEPPPPSTKGMTVFSYYPFTGANTHPWNVIVAAKRAHPRLNIIVTVNPSNGTEYWQPWVRRAKEELSPHGIKVIGYVATGDCCGSASRPLSTITANIDQVASAGLDGVFFDESASTSPNRIEVYRQAVAHMKSKGMTLAISNPGSCPGGIAAQEPIFDIICTFENPRRPTVQEVIACPVSKEKKSIIPHNVGTSFDEALFREIIQHTNYYYEVTRFNAWHETIAFPPWFDRMASIIDSTL